MSRQIVYRFYDDDSALLYVGVTDNPRVRWGHHRRTKAWWGEVAAAVIERHPNRASALAAERDAIRTERPRYNAVHNGHVRQLRLPFAPPRVELIPIVRPTT